MSKGRGIVRPARRPAGWTAPGPAPAGPQGRADLEPAPDEDLCFLAGDWRLFQKQRGHRWSLDDLVTAWVATRGIAAPARALDLGCGLGSVLLMVAWIFPDAEVTGIEAQPDRAAMGRRSIAYNGADARCRILDGDLRDAELAGMFDQLSGPFDRLSAPPLGGAARSGKAGPFDLITGTPPYFPIGTGTESGKTHAAPARFEHRGGVEDYLAAAARYIAPHGRITICTSARERERVAAAVTRLGLAHREHWAVIPRAGKDPLVDVDVLEAGGPARPALRELVVRDRAGRWTAEFQQVRADLGMPVTPP